MPCLFPLREDLIGKRIITLRSCTTGNTNAERLIRRGVIRASTAENSQESDVKVLVEYDGDKSWRCRQWVAVYKEFNNFLIEDNFVWAKKYDGSSFELKLALAFRSLVVKPGDAEEDSRPIWLEFLCDKTLTYQAMSSIVQPFKMKDISGLVDDDKILVLPWISCHFAQLLLLSSPSLAKGHQVEVYNSVDNDSQWHSARILSADDQTKLITLLDESKSERRTENAALIQISGLPMVPGSKLRKEAVKLAKQILVKKKKLAKKQPNKCLKSPVHSKRTKKTGAKDQGTCSRQTEAAPKLAKKQKLAKKRQSEGLNSPVDSKRTKKTGAKDQGTFSRQSEHFSTINFVASLNTVYLPYELPPNSAAQKTRRGMRLTC